ncbi:hypothetical protein Scep_027676 [Stephania cephalantha]|uniref:Uncharacterized protein n=1 Tax=Stephania cephalantha TaxID=152367 RepID=A0AAP0E8H6_9MAGN
MYGDVSVPKDREVYLGHGMKLTWYQRTERTERWRIRWWRSGCTARARSSGGGDGSSSGSGVSGRSGGSADQVGAAERPRAGAGGRAHCPRARAIRGGWERQRRNLADLVVAAEQPRAKARAGATETIMKRSSTRESTDLKLGTWL